MTSLREIYRDWQEEENKITLARINNKEELLQKIKLYLPEYFHAEWDQERENIRIINGDGLFDVFPCHILPCIDRWQNNPLALLEAIYEDSITELVDRLKMKRKKEKKNVDEPLTDIELYGDTHNMVSHCMFNKDGSLKKFGWFYAGEIMGDKIVFATYFTYLAMLRSCKMEYDNEGFPKLTIKKNRAIWVEMY